MSSNQINHQRENAVESRQSDDENGYDNFVLADEIGNVVIFWFEVLIKSCCCNISGTWFVGVILVIAGFSKDGIVIFWSLFGSVKICTDCFRKNFHHFDISEISYQF